MFLINGLQTPETMNKQSNKLDFSGQNIYAGFDVHKKDWRVTIMTDNLVLKTFSQPPKPEILHQHLVKNYPGATYYAAYEAGFCGYWIHNRLLALGINSMVVNPADIPTTHKEKVQKDDVRDSKKIARSLSAGELKPIYVPQPATLEDRCLVRTRATIVKDMTRNKNRVKQFLFFHGIEYPAIFQNTGTHWSKRFFQWLDGITMTQPSAQQSLSILVENTRQLRAQLSLVTKQITQLAKTEKYAEDVMLLTGISGMGRLTAMVLLTEIDTISRFKNNDQFCSFIGLVPTTHSSGEKHITGDLTPRGHSILRSAIMESAWVAVRHDPSLMVCYNRYCKRMEPNKAIIRIARKLLNRIMYVLKNKKPYVPRMEFNIRAINTSEP